MNSQVHRFRDTVAVYIGKGETVYMTPHQARELGQALIDTADDIDKVKFTESTLPTFTVNTL